MEDRLLGYAVRIIRVAESMKRSAADMHIADQLLRPGTSPYGNHGEAEGAESRERFYSQTSGVLQGAARIAAVG